ncbi:Anti-sigma regulatory factor (Ser/Thr protein kinase) [Frankia canadensis]|uniref:Anti-sigma regulatory factor (Ser/Thr protein kinase) n=1 Tax=Frankia canadensis TaxID=1836972 RepID=A0A2I2KYH5_9ACTN|nr:ATP-binding protein [Frankia canadensis]SNQ50715.1 Anti-sigma regulatory factor (Ser/Thr protein kinase) [Frankia canadensis]SOU58005.1 Anti-sigma regulatory factor (Ser/Thr protein kinase) [Frankia canadensis]
MAGALTARFDLPADPRAAGWARRLVAELLAAWNRAETIEVAQLLVSEVVTNAVRFIGDRGALCLTVALRIDRIRITVDDGSSLRPALRPAGEDDESGRGMHLVAALALQWGVDDVQDDQRPGKQVWFDLPRQPDPPRQEGSLEAACGS